MGLLLLSLDLLFLAVIGWLFWPVAAEPALRKYRASRRRRLAPSEDVVDGLFTTWSRHGPRPGLVLPDRSA